MFNHRFPPLRATGRFRRAVERVVVVIAGPNPSLDYYLEPRLTALGTLPTKIVELEEAPSRAIDADEWRGALVLFCRYASSAWMQAIDRHANEIAGVGLFVDDDIDALAADRTVPLWYRLRLLRRHLWHRSALAQHCNVLYVANEELKARNVAAHPRLLTPIASISDAPVARPPQDTTRIVFHSTSVHDAEHKWLKRTIKNALAAAPSITFEAIAGAPLSWRWRGLERSRIVTPMPWPQYRTASRERGADLLLAPLMQTTANAARAWTKRIDAMRLGAALLVSDAAVYRPDEEEASLGMCVPLDPSVWARAISDLSRDRPRLNRLRDLNRRWVERESAAPGGLLSDDMLPQ